MPACTPAVQGELFYGVKTVVPAFAFKDPDAKRIVRMYEPAIAAETSGELAHRQPLALGERHDALAAALAGVGLRNI